MPLLGAGAAVCSSAGVMSGASLEKSVSSMSTELPLFIFLVGWGETVSSSGDRLVADREPLGLAVVADTPTNWDQYFLNTIQVSYATRFDRDASSTV